MFRNTQTVLGVLFVHFHKNACLSHVLITLETHLWGSNFYSLELNAKWEVTWCKVSACGFCFLNNSAVRSLEISPSLYFELQFHNQMCQTRPDLLCVHVCVCGWVDDVATVTLWLRVFQQEWKHCCPTADFHKVSPRWPQVMRNLLTHTHTNTHTLAVHACRCWLYLKPF